MRLFEKPHIDPKNFGQDEEVLRRWGGEGGGVTLGLLSKFTFSRSKVA